MRTDLLAQTNDIRLDQLTSEVTFGEVRLQDDPNPLWLPIDVQVDLEIHGHKFRGVQHYTNYQRFRVSSKIMAH